ncbi:MAG: response regulator [Candidatus Promineifilaceae bacterium]|nr:response regulator [Candidatus Promineifilaceae bacterium]
MEDATILVVDDAEVNRYLLRDTLSQFGYAVEMAADGGEALRMAHAQPPDLILLDISMPKMDGFEACRRLKADPATREIPVLFLSALDETSSKVQAFEVGGVDYVTKPFRLEELQARVQTHLALRHLQQELQQANESLERRVAERTADLVQLNRAYERFVPRAFLSHLQKEQITDVQLGDHIQDEMTILFSDIRDFTALSEQLAPRDTFDFLNDYLRRVSPVIQQYGGFIDKYLGDGLMAIFPSSVDHAVEAAIRICKMVGSFNRERATAKFEAIRVGTGIHTGRLILGVIGEPERMQGTVIADAVNVAARLEGLTRVYGVSLLISAETLQKLQNKEFYNFRFLDFVRPRGKAKRIAVFEIFDGDSEEQQQLKAATRPALQRAQKLFHEGQMAAARLELLEIRDKNPEDTVVEFYLSRTATYEKSNPLLASG